MDFDTPDIGAMQELCREFNATLLVDVAHDFGNIGEDGRGHIGLQQMIGKVDLVMGSFSKTFASNGGFVCNPLAGGCANICATSEAREHSPMRCRLSRRPLF